MKNLLFPVALILCLLQGGAARAYEQGPASLALQEQTTINAIAGDLLLARLNEQGLGNAMTSAVSLYYALSVLSGGANGETRRALDVILTTAGKEPSDELAPALLESLSSSFADDNATAAFRLAHSLWSDSGSPGGSAFHFLEDFLARSARLYGAEHEAMDFRSSDTVRAINHWAEEQTRGLIPSIIDAKTLETLDWAILNAAVFEGNWATAMRRTGPRSNYHFNDINGNSIAAQSIRTVDYVAAVADLSDGSVAFKLPFKGEKYAFIVHLAPENLSDTGLWLIEESVPRIADVVSTALNMREPLHQLSIEMPVFAFSDAVEMRGDSAIAVALGLDPLFRPSADFSLLSDQKSAVSLIKQDTRIELDENGVRAAAVTLIGGVRATNVGPRFPRRSIMVDRPFSFALVELESQTILFNGVITSVESNR
jgi:serpin B